MAKKFGKFVLFTAALGTAAAAAYYYIQKKEKQEEFFDPEDDDYDNFGPDSDSSDKKEGSAKNASRSYVTLNSSVAGIADTVKDTAAEIAATAKDTVSHVADAAKDKIKDVKDSISETAAKFADSAEDTDNTDTVSSQAVSTEEDSVDFVDKSLETIEDNFTPLAEQAVSAAEEKLEESVEEFFDEETLDEVSKEVLSDK